MAPLHILGLVAFAALLSAGQILFKSAALAAPSLNRSASFVALLQLPTFWAALFLYGGATLLWIYLMQVIPLSRGYPFAALGFVIVPVAGILLFDERVSISYLAGAALVISGLALISRG